MNKKPRVGLWRVLTILCAILCIGSIVGNHFANQYATTINVALGTSFSKIQGFDENVKYFESDFESEDARWEYERELCAQVEAEGAALLKNDNQALPLAGGSKVSLFARGSVELMYGGTGYQPGSQPQGRPHTGRHRDQPGSLGLVHLHFREVRPQDPRFHL